MNQRTIFDITPAPEPEPVSQVVEPELERSPWFKYELPVSPDVTSILSVGDRILIIPAKYSQPANCPGIVKGFIGVDVVITRRDGEGLYLRRELHKISETK